MADHQAPFIGHARAQMNGGLRELARHLCELEQSLLQPDVRKSPALVDLLDDDFTEFGTSGRIYTKSDLLEALQAESPSKQTASDFKVTTLSRREPRFSPIAFVYIVSRLCLRCAARCGAGQAETGS
jgi:Domain of unknown function (DUF4440)